MSFSFHINTTVTIGRIPYIFNIPSNDNPNVAKMLGHGTFGTVFVATDTVHYFQRVAIKFIRHVNNASINELFAYRALSQIPSCSRYIVCLLNEGLVYIKTDKYYALVIELMDGNIGSIVPNAEEFVELLKALVYGIYEIHNKRYAHHDLKLANVLYKNLPGGKKIFKIADLGTVCRGEVLSNVILCADDTGAVTEKYTSPELCDVLVNWKTTPAVRTMWRDHATKLYKDTDIWAMGLILFYMLRGELPQPYSTCAAIQNLKQEDIAVLNVTTAFPGISTDAVNKIVNYALMIHDRPPIGFFKDLLDASLRVVIPLPRAAPVVSRETCKYYNLNLDRDQIIAELAKHVPKTNVYVKRPDKFSTEQLCEVLLEQVVCKLPVKTSRKEEEISIGNIICILRILGSPIPEREPKPTLQRLCEEMKKILERTTEAAQQRLTRRILSIISKLAVIDAERIYIDKLMIITTIWGAEKLFLIDKLKTELTAQRKFTELVAFPGGRAVYERYTKILSEFIQNISPAVKR